MGRIWMTGGGGGVDLDVVTTEAGDVLKGKVIIGPDGEPLTGTLELDGDAADSHVLAGKTYYNTNAKAKRTGTMPVRAAKNVTLKCGESCSIDYGYHTGEDNITAASLASQTEANAVAGDILSGKDAWVKGAKIAGNIAVQTPKDSSLNCGGSVTMAAGYYNKAVKVTANSLSSQTEANAIAGNILDGKTAWVNGNKITGTMTVQSILSFSAAPYGAKQVTFTWKNPAKGPFSGIIIVYKTGSYPTSISDETRIYKGSGNNTSAGGTSSVTCTMPSENTTYYFRAYSYATQNNGEWVHSTTYTASATTARSSYTFTSSGTFTVPAGCSKIDIFCVGGGGGGGNGGTGSMNSTSALRAGSGGAGGYTKTALNVSVSAGSSYAITVGAGGGAGAAGGTSSLGSLCSAAGGGAGSTAETTTKKGGDGGSGGGTSDVLSYSTTSSSSTLGASDGADASNKLGANTLNSSKIGKGQGTTTRAFGESSGTLYAGGGGAARCYGSKVVSTMIYVTKGGDGGGGNSGGSTLTALNGSAGTANTGGGGGGGAAAYNGGQQYGSGGQGGAGIVIVRPKFG